MRKTSILVLAVVLSAIGAASASAESCTVRNLQEFGYKALNVRAAPERNGFNVIGELYGGQTIQVNQRRPPWVQIYFPLTGWALEWEGRNRYMTCSGGGGGGNAGYAPR